MTVSRPTLVLFAAAAIVFFAVVGTSLGNPRDARPAAEAALMTRAGSDCIQQKLIYSDLQAVDAFVARSAPNDGWVVPERVFVGELAAAGTDLDAGLVGDDGRIAWLLTTEATPRLFGLAPRGTFGKTAYFVMEITAAIPC